MACCESSMTCELCIDPRLEAWSRKKEGSTRANSGRFQMGASQQ